MLIEQHEDGQSYAIEHFDAFVEITVHDANEMGKREATEDPPAPIDENGFGSLAGADALQVRDGGFLAVNI